MTRYFIYCLVINYYYIAISWNPFASDVLIWAVNPLVKIRQKMLQQSLLHWKAQWKEQQHYMFPSGGIIVGELKNNLPDHITGHFLWILDKICFQGCSKGQNLVHSDLIFPFLDFSLLRSVTLLPPPPPHCPSLPNPFPSLWKSYVDCCREQTFRESRDIKIFVDNSPKSIECNTK